MAWIIYTLAAILWGVFCLRMQIKLYGATGKKIPEIALCLTGNFLFWPISMIIAIVLCRIEVKKDTEKEVE